MVDGWLMVRWLIKYMRERSTINHQPSTIINHLIISHLRQHEIPFALIERVIPSSIEKRRRDGKL